MSIEMIIEIPSPRYYGVVHKYKLTEKQFVLYQDIVQDQPLSSTVIHKLLTAGVLTTEIKQI
jgi:hypothetical protein